MPELPRSSKYVSTPDAPLDEAERNRLIARLNEAYGDGKVAADAYRAHLDTLFSASRLGEVAGIVAELPPLATHDTPAIVPVGSGQPGELTPSGGPRPFPVLMTVMVGAAAAMALLGVVILVLLTLL